MSKVLKIAGEVIAIGALAVVTCGAALGVAAGFSIGASVSAAVGVFGAIGLSLGTVVAIGAGLMLAGGLLAKKPQVSPSQIDRTKVSLVLDAPREIVFGHTALGTALRWQLFWGTEQEYVSQVLVVASHWCESIDQVWLNDQIGWDATSGTASAFNGYFFVGTRPQSTPGTGYNDGSNGAWGASDAFAGCATIHLQGPRAGRRPTMSARPPPPSRSRQRSSSTRTRPPRRCARTAPSPAGSAARR